MGSNCKWGGLVIYPALYVFGIKDQHYIPLLVHHMPSDECIITLHVCHPAFMVTLSIMPSYSSAISPRVKGANRIKIRWRRVFMLPCWRNSSRKQGRCWGVSPPFEFQGTGSESSLIDAMVLMVKLICWCEVALYITLRYAIPFPVGRTSCLSCLAYSSLFERTKSYCVPSLLGMPYRLKSRPSPWQGP